MSYQIVKDIKIDNKKEKIFIYSCYNNVSPKRYYKRDFDYNNNDFDSKKYNLFYSVLTGNHHLLYGNYNYKKAFETFLEFLNKNNLHQQDLWNYSKDSEEIRHYYKVFNSFLSVLEKNDFILDQTFKHDSSIDINCYDKTNDYEGLEF